METKSKTKEIVIAVICLLIFAGVYAYVLNNFMTEDDNGPTVIHDVDKNNKDYIRVNIQIINVDPVKGDIQARMNFDPQGEYSDDGLVLNQDVTMYVNSISGKNEHNFSKGKRMPPVDITLEMYDGVVTDYPFDKHTAEISMLMVTKEKTDSGVTESNITVVKEIDFKANIHGFTIEENIEPGKQTDYTEFEIHIARTKPVIFFSCFVMALMWCIIITSILIMLSVIVRNRKMEYSMFGFFASLLFALPALRGIQPFVPALGCLSDYIAFFWAEGIVAINLIIMISVWLKRPGAKQS